MSGAALLVILSGFGCGSGGVDSANQAPGIPAVSTVDGSPGSGVAGTSLSPTLRWRADDPEGQSLNYDLYFGASPLPPLVDSGLRRAEYQLDSLEYATTYYWRVVACDPAGLCTPSPRWHFTTRASVQIPVFSDPAQPVVVKVGESFRIELPTDPERRHLWSWLDPIDKDLVGLSEQSLRTDGGAAWQVWEFNTRAVGRTTLSLALIQEGSTAPLDVAHFELIIYQ